MYDSRHRDNQCILFDKSKWSKFWLKHTFQEIYTLGKLNLYIEQGVCFLSDGQGDWVPTSIIKLFQKVWFFSESYLLYKYYFPKN